MHKERRNTETDGEHMPQTIKAGLVERSGIHEMMIDDNTICRPVEMARAHYERLVRVVIETNLFWTQIVAVVPVSEHANH